MHRIKSIDVVCEIGVFTRNISKATIKREIIVDSLCYRFNVDKSEAELSIDMAIEAGKVIVDKESDLFLPDKINNAVSENIKLEDKINEFLKDVSPIQKGMIFSSLLIQVAFMIGMTKDKLLFIIEDLYDSRAKVPGKKIN